MKPTLRLGHIALSFHEASAAMVRLLLEREGYDVETLAGLPVEMFEMYGRGEVDLLVSAWLPASHGVYLEPFVAETQTLGVLYELYYIWGVPDDVPAGVVDQVTDLLRPEVLARMER